MRTIYLDNNATTRVAPAVLDAMLPFLREQYGNPSSLHHLGLRAADALRQARAEVAELFGARSAEEVVFNSGATEGNQTALRSAFAARDAAPARRRLVTTSVEHSAVLEPLEAMVAHGFELEHVPVQASGALELERLLEAIDERTALVSVMWANNETGVVHPVEEIAARCREYGALLHVDAAQAAGKLPLDLRSTPIDFCTISAHKFHGPKGAGALYARSGAPLRAWQVGGGQEAERRAGTENIPGIVGLGAAARLAREWAAGPGPGELTELRQVFERDMARRCAGVHVHGSGQRRLATTANLRFEGLSGEALVILMSEEGICASTGSACSSGRQAPSHVLLAMGESAKGASSAVRFSLSRETTREEIEHCLARVPELVGVLRQLAGSSGTLESGPPEPMKG